MKSKNGMKKIGMTVWEELTYEELHERYIKKCKVNNLSEHTINFYNVSYRTFNKFISLPTLMVKDITRDLIDDYILHLQDTGVKSITVNTYIHGISPVIKFGMELNIIERFGFKDIKTTEEIKDVYTEAELSLLLDKPEMKSFTEYRNWTIINFLLGTGVRALEMRSIKVKDIDLSASMLIVRRTKNKKQRYVPISKALNETLSEYIEFRKANSEDDYLFCNEFGEFMPRTTLQMAITKYCKKRGLNKYSIHLFRHTFAKYWILKGGDIFTLQKILGHSSLKMVKHYANLFDEDLKHNYDNLCPLDNVIKTKRSRVKIK